MNADFMTQFRPILNTAAQTIENAQRRQAELQVEFDMAMFEPRFREQSAVVEIVQSAARILTENISVRILAVLRKHTNHQNGFSAAELCTLCNVYRDGTLYFFERAMLDLQKTGAIEIAGQDHKGRTRYILKQAAPVGSR